jgi:hypothetical protein
VHFEALVALASPALRRTGHELRKLILSINPEATQLVWPKPRIASFGIGPKKNTQHYVYLAIHTNHINLGFYRGASLQSYGLRLEGAGKNLRHIKIVDSTILQKRALISILRESLRERRTHAPAA